MIKVSFRILVALLALAATAFAQQLPTDQERLLIPVVPGALAGAFGSSWETELAIANSADIPIRVFGYETTCNSFIQCSTVPGPIPPHTTGFIFGGVGNCSPASGHIFITDRATADNLFVTLRSRDVSRDNRAWGSIVPVVRTRDRFSRPFSIVDVPVGTPFRALLRLYAMNPDLAAGVRVRFLSVDPNGGQSGADALISEMTPALAIPPAESSPFCPAYAAILLSGQPSLRNATRIRIEVIPSDTTDSTQQYWGFVSVTNNDTQEVSIIAPR